MKRKFVILATTFLLCAISAIAQTIGTGQKPIIPSTGGAGGTNDRSLQTPVYAWYNMSTSQITVYTPDYSAGETILYDNSNQEAIHMYSINCTFSVANLPLGTYILYVTNGEWEESGMVVL